MATVAFQAPLSGLEHGRLAPDGGDRLDLMLVYAGTILPDSHVATLISAPERTTAWLMSGTGQWTLRARGGAWSFDLVDDHRRLAAQSRRRGVARRLTVRGGSAECSVAAAGPGAWEIACGGQRVARVVAAGDELAIEAGPALARVPEPAALLALWLVWQLRSGGGAPSSGPSLGRRLFDELLGP